MLLVDTRSGVVGGLGCGIRLATAPVSGVMAMSSAVPLGVGETAVLVIVGAKVNLVCRLTFGSVSFAGVTLVCFVFSPRLGEECFPLVPLRFAFLPMVDVLVESVLFKV